MNRSNYKKKLVILSLVIFALTTLVPTPVIAAIGVDTALDALRVPIILKGEDILSQALDAALQEGDVGVCLATRAADIARTEVTKAIEGLAMVTDNIALVGALEANLKTLEADLITCSAAQVLVKAKSIFNSSLVGIQRKQTALNEIERQVQNLSAAKNEVETQLRIARQGFWRAVLTRVLLTVSKTLTNRLVASLNQKYKINDFARYADAMAGQVYSAERIYNAAPDKNDQMILRSIMTSASLPGKINPGVFAKVQGFIGFDPKTVDFTQADFYEKSLRLGSCEANPACVNLISRQSANIVQQQALRDAQTEVSQSGGYKAPRTCSSSVVEQRVIDQQRIAVEKKITDRRELELSLARVQAVNPKQVKQADIDRAHRDYQAAVDEYNSLVGRKFDSPVLKHCDSIASPAQAIDKGINALIGNYVKNISDYSNDNNFPFLLRFTSQIAGDFVGRLLTGIGSGSSSSDAKLVNEDQTIGSGVVTDINYETDDALTIEKEGVSFTFRNGQEEGQIILQWDATSRKNAGSVKLSGPGVAADAPTTLQGEHTVTITQTSTFTLALLKKDGQPILDKNDKPKVFSLEVPFGAAAAVADGTDQGTESGTGKESSDNDGPGSGSGPAAGTETGAVLGSVISALQQSFRGSVSPRN
jgi:hypothetical protein